MLWKRRHLHLILASSSSPGIPFLIVFLNKSMHMVFYLSAILLLCVCYRIVSILFLYFFPLKIALSETFYFVFSSLPSNPRGTSVVSFSVSDFQLGKSEVFPFDFQVEN